MVFLRVPRGQQATQELFSRGGLVALRGPPRHPQPVGPVLTPLSFARFISVNSFFFNHGNGNSTIFFFMFTSVEPL